MTETTLRKRARELLKPLFLRPCSVEERAVCDAVESFIERQQQVIDLLMKAVEPFAYEAELLDLQTRPSGEALIAIGELRMKHLRRAREAKVEAERILNHSHPGLEREKE